MLPAHEIPLALYIHIPFCERKCPYCDFNSSAISYDETLYTQALFSDLRFDCELFALENRPVQSIFFGGGTPSLFSAAAIAEILAGVNQLLTISNTCEITLEANPSSAEQSKFRAYREAGIKRISLGVQSFEDKNLALLGRIHSSRDAHNAIAAAQSAGFVRINTDLIFALPAQSPQEACRDLEIASSLGVEHLSWYQLSIEENTAFFASPPPNLPDDELCADIFSAGKELLERKGFRQYEVSAWTRGEPCRHNCNYWQFGDYLGIGAGAHGKITHQGQIWRSEKLRSANAYLRASSQEKNPYCAKLRQILKEEQAFEFMLNALRLKAGVAKAVLPARTQVCLEELKKITDALEQEGLLSEDDFYRCTQLGFAHLNTVLERFL